LWERAIHAQNRATNWIKRSPDARAFNGARSASIAFDPERVAIVSNSVAHSPESQLRNTYSRTHDSRHPHPMHRAKQLAELGETPTVREPFVPAAVERSSPSVQSRPTQPIAMNGHEPSI
jgi:hypothetical protein